MKTSVPITEASVAIQLKKMRSKDKWVKAFKNGSSKICGRQPLKNSKWHHFKFFKGCLPQVLLGPFLNTLTQIFLLTVVFKSSQHIFLEKAYFSKTLFGKLWSIKYLFSIYGKIAWEGWGKIAFEIPPQCRNAYGKIAFSDRFKLFDGNAVCKKNIAFNLKISS